MIYQKWMGEVAGLVLVLALLAGIWGHGYGKGKASVAAEMSALRESYALQQAADKGRYEAQVKALTVRNSQIENDYARSVKDLGVRAAAAESRYYGLLEQFAAATRPAGTLPAADPAQGTHGSPQPGSDERDRRFAGSLARVAGECERTAAQLKALQDWAAGLNAVY